MKWLLTDQIVGWKCVRNHKRKRNYINSVTIFQNSFDIKIFLFNYIEVDANPNWGFDYAFAAKPPISASTIYFCFYRNISI